MQTRDASCRSTNASHKSWRDVPSMSSLSSSSDPWGSARGPGRQQRGLAREQDVLAGDSQRHTTAAALTRCVGKLLLLPLDPVLQRLCFPTCLLDASLHRLGRHVARPAWIHFGECAVINQAAIGRWSGVARDLARDLAAMGMIGIERTGGSWRLGWLNAEWPVVEECELQGCGC